VTCVVYRSISTWHCSLQIHIYVTYIVYRSINNYTDPLRLRQLEKIKGKLKYEQFWKARRFFPCGMKAAKEYCWAITQAAGRSCCGRVGFSVRLGTELRERNHCVSRGASVGDISPSGDYIPQKCILARWSRTLMKLKKRNDARMTDAPYLTFRHNAICQGIQNT
jgi:hypothetical protein